jgi:hypothetical protein
MPFNDTVIPNTTVTLLPGGQVGGMVTSTWDLDEGNAGRTLQTQIPNILEGRAYINFHTVQFGGGEVRANFTPIPEPGTVLLLYSGLGLVLYRARRWKRV